MQISWVVSVQFSRSIMSDPLRPHGLQYARLPCPSPIPGAYSNSCPLSQWCHPTISSSDVPFSSHLQSFPVSGSFPMSQFFTAGGQSIGVSASASVLSMNIQMWKPPTKWKMLDYLRTMSTWPQATWSLRTEKVNPCDITLFSHPSANQRTVPADHIPPLPSLGFLKHFAETLQRVRDFWGREPHLSPFMTLQ